jgi:hypothetical protein
MSLRANDVSVVLAGPAREHLTTAVDAVRRILPEAELILSTWRASAPDVDVDVLVENDDPGTLGLNTNRMFRSARQGVLRATRPYVLKLRTDAVLTGTGFLDWFGIAFPRNNAYRVFSERLLTLTIATRPSHRMPGYLFHPSDCVHFGRRADVRRMWSVPEIDETENSTLRGISSTKRTGPQFWNEQALWLSVLRTSGYKVNYSHWGSAVTPDVITASQQSIVNNFTVLEPWQFGVELPKLKQMVQLSSLDTYMSFAEWRQTVSAQPRLAG